MRREDSDGFPTDYVIARIRGREAALISDWQALIAGRATPETSDERIWEALLREMEWLHAQLNRGLRDTLAPLFALFEIKTVVLCLRNRAIGRTREIERLLEHSLLADDVKEILLHSRDVRTAVAALQLGHELDETDPAAFENALMRALLEDLAAQALEPALKTFFTRFVDLRNVMLLYKQLRWRPGTRGLFISGGTLDLLLLEGIANRGDDAAFDDLLRRVAGTATISVASTEGALETVLLRTLTKELQTGRRTADELAVLVEYVWRLYVQARNLAVLHHGAVLEETTLEREMIL